MKIGEYWASEEKPVIEGDYIRGLLILGRTSKNPADTDGGRRGTSTVTRKFNKICESETLYNKFDGVAAHIGPHKFDGSYTDDEWMGSFHNVVSTAKGLRADLLCRKVGEAYHPQAVALRDHIEHDRGFGGFSPLFDGDTDMSTGEVQTVDAVCSIDWVTQSASTKSISESEAMAYEHGKEVAELRAEHEKAIAECNTRIGECHEALSRHIAEYHSPKVAESKAEETGGVKTVPPPAPKPIAEAVVDPYNFVRGKKP